MPADPTRPPADESPAPVRVARGTPGAIYFPPPAAPDAAPEAADGGVRPAPWWVRALPALPALALGTVAIVVAARVSERRREDALRVAAAELHADTEARLADADRALRAGAVGEALEQADALLKRLHDARRARRADRNRAYALHAASRVMRGEILLARAGPDGPDSKHGAAGADTAGNDAAEAAREFARAAQAADASPAAAAWRAAAWYGLSRAHVRRHAWMEAAEALDRLLAVNPHHGAGYALRARTRRVLGDAQGARRDARAAASLGADPPARERPFRF